MHRLSSAAPDWRHGRFAAQPRRRDVPWRCCSRCSRSAPGVVPRPRRSGCPTSATSRRPGSRRRRNASSASRWSRRSAPRAGTSTTPRSTTTSTSSATGSCPPAPNRSDFEFFAVADPSINAFALPGGFVGVNTGLVLLAQTESELASVLAHEITHVTQRHCTRSLAGQQRSLLYSLAALAVAIAASRSGSSSAGQATSAAIASAQALAIQTQLNYTREHEYEADRIGFQRLMPAGFDPTSMATFMDRLQKSNRFADGNAPSYLRSHPITYERVAEAQARAYGEPYRQVGRLARLPPRARAAAQLHGHRPRRPSRTSARRWPSASSTIRWRRATASSPRCCAPRTSPPRSRSSQRSRTRRRRTR